MEQDTPNFKPRFAVGENFPVQSEGRLSSANPALHFRRRHGKHVSLGTKMFGMGRDALVSAPLSRLELSHSLRDMLTSQAEKDLAFARVKFETPGAKNLTKDTRLLSTDFHKPLRVRTDTH
eukprot:TRINITY_DN96710_c0_g1_i1.p2 TRINITY_DN96710_c0_g1~~TRINITY_DN96710_c0_g1_i1.p2  ORF type:complete len:121 (+),score=11.51 TRINITY_DN96710_c0_g1_i1:2-364(+)